MAFNPDPHDFTIRKGASVSESFTFEAPAGSAIDLAAGGAYTFTAKMRTEKDGASTEIVSFTIDSTNYATGVVRIELTNVQTAAIDYEFGYYDILKYNASDEEPYQIWMRGKITIEETVTP